MCCEYIHCFLCSLSVRLGVKEFLMTHFTKERGPVVFDPAPFNVYGTSIPFGIDFDVVVLMGQQLSICVVYSQ